MKAEAAQRYWKTHNFDPVNCNFYDQDKENDYLKEREQYAKIHGKDQVKKLPITV